jgi:hypothetical protein
MRRTVILVAILLAGCNNVSGPAAPRGPQRVDDPLLSTREQQKVGRARLALPDESPTVAPPAGVYLPGPHGR